MVKIFIVCYIGICIFGFQLDQTWEFWVLAVAVGLCQGGIQALSRSYYGKLIPKEASNEYFGFFDIFGKFADFFGPHPALCAGAHPAHPVGKGRPKGTGLISREKQNAPAAGLKAVGAFFIAGASFPTTAAACCRAAHWPPPAAGGTGRRGCRKAAA